MNVKKQKAIELKGYVFEKKNISIKAFVDDKEVGIQRLNSRSHPLPWVLRHYARITELLCNINGKHKFNGCIHTCMIYMYIITQTICNYV